MKQGQPCSLFRSVCLAAVMMAAGSAAAERETVLQQIDLPHPYYFREMYLPQLTSGPSSLAWSPDGKSLVYSMRGSLWVQALGSTRARQLTAGPGYDYQPDWSPEGSSIVFSRYLDDAVELMLMNPETGGLQQLTDEGQVNVEPRWSPDGKRLAWVSTRDTGRFKLYVGTIQNGDLVGERWLPDRISETQRYYYSGYDHELSPSWSPDGAALLYVSNPETPYGTGGIWRRSLGVETEAALVHDEETTWKARPDWSPDGRRVIWSSYHGRQWHQLWIMPADGHGDPLPLSYGDFDVTAARWSPDGSQIAYISNEHGGKVIVVQDTLSGRRQELQALEREYLRPMGRLQLDVVDTAGRPLAARIAVRGADKRSYAPDTAWIHGDDAFDRAQASGETHYFHSAGHARLTLRAGPAQVTVYRGLEYGIERRTVEIAADETAQLAVPLKLLELPEGWRQRWPSADVHVHMNYGGAYRNTPERLVAQAAAEDLDLVFNLAVNKEQRIPDIGYFSTAPDQASTSDVLLLHAQEFHTGYWGHLGLLGLSEHFLLPDYSAYANTALASPFPDNAAVSELARSQGALVGYVHPFDAAPDPASERPLTHALPIDVALGKVDYYEVSGFSDYRETRDVWYRLLNCGFRVAAAGGTDAMANYASLRGPVGLNRVYVEVDEYVEVDQDAGSAAARRDRWLEALKAGRSVATNGPLLGFELQGPGSEPQGPGSELKLPAGSHRLQISGFMRSIVPVDHLEVVLNGEVVQVIERDSSSRKADFASEIELDRSGWVLLRAWNDGPSPDIFDRFPYATTNPVFVEVGGEAVRSPADAEYFLQWIERVEAATLASEAYNSPGEKQRVLEHIEAAKAVFEQRR